MQQALKAIEMATQYPISQESLSDFSEKHMGLVKRVYNDKDVVIYGLPGGNICVPTLEDDNEGYTHIMHGKVNLKQLSLIIFSFFLKEWYKVSTRLNFQQCVETGFNY